MILRLRSFLDMLTREYRGDRVLVVAHQVIVNCMRYLLERLDEERDPRDRPSRPTSRTAASRRTASIRSAGRHGKLVLQLENFVSPLREAGAPVTAEPDLPARRSRDGRRSAPPIEIDARLLRDWPLPRARRQRRQGGARRDAGHRRQREMPGAAALAAISALRAGAGKLAVAAVASDRRRARARARRKRASSRCPRPRPAASPPKGWRRSSRSSPRSTPC